MAPLEEKKRNNIASYIISMWHVEDLMRANALDLARVDAALVRPMDAAEPVKEEMRAWYAGIIQRMQAEGLARQGHLSDVDEVLTDLEFLHNTLVNVMHETEYDGLFQAAEPGITALQRQADDAAEGPITTCFTAIYGVMVLRAQGKTVSASTTEAEGHMRRLLERLSFHYKQMRKLPGVSMN